MVGNMLAFSMSEWTDDIGTTLSQVLDMTLVRWATWCWGNDVVICQWWHNEVANQMPTLAKRLIAIWVDQTNLLYRIPAEVYAIIHIILCCETVTGR